MKCMIDILEKEGFDKDMLKAMNSNDLINACGVAAEIIPRKQKVKRVRVLEWVVCTAMRELRQAQAEEKKAAQAQEVIAQAQGRRRRVGRPSRYED